MLVKIVGVLKYSEMLVKIAGVLKYSKYSLS